MSTSEPLGTPQYLPGIDVSHFQGVIDWTKVKAAGIGFAFIKATDGLSFVDPMLSENVSGCVDAGIPFGLYHFFRPSLDGGKQAGFFLENTLNQRYFPGTDIRRPCLPAALDLEIGPMETSEASAWLDTVDAALGREPLVYTSPSFAQANLAFGPPIGVYPLWIAEYTTKPEPNVPTTWSEWEFWQHTPRGQVDGVPNLVDLDWFHGTSEDLKAWVK